jgi:hypothetical protein
MIDNPDLMVVGVLMFVGTLWLFNIAMENGPFIDDFPIKTSIYKGFSISAPRSTTFDCTITRFLCRIARGQKSLNWHFPSLKRLRPTFLRCYINTHYY